MDALEREKKKEREFGRRRRVVMDDALGTAGMEVLWMETLFINRQPH